jgi:predicted HicB family RNase H-like nuclease
VSGRKKKTAAERARKMAAKHPDESPSQIAARIGSYRQRVHGALNVTHERRGRPGVESRTVRLSSDLLDTVESRAKRANVSVRAWIEAAIRKSL